MSKLQLITKAVITTIGVSTAVSFLRNANFSPRTAGDMHILLLVIMSIVPLTFLSAVIYYLIFNNDWLVRIAAPKGQAIPHIDQQRTLAIWLRLLLVFSGLRLLLNSSRAFRLLLHVSPLKIRPWVQGLLRGD